MLDLRINGGTIVDGTGRAPFVGDVGIADDRVVAVGDVDDSARRVIDADGLLVTPGFVDIHTHLDAQVAWDPLATSSCWHGVTSAVLGSCGVTFAPVRAGQEEWLAGLMQAVEDIPAASIMAGLPWGWDTYGEYLAALDTWPKALNLGGMVGHCALRYYAMGDRSLDKEPPTADELSTIVRLVDEAISSGALGFSTSRTLMHVVPGGRRVPGTWAGPEELMAIADVLGKHGRGVLQAVPRFEFPGDDFESTRAEINWMAEAARRSGRPVTFAIAQTDLMPELHRRVLSFAAEVARDGVVVRPQTTGRGISSTYGIMAARTFFDASPEWSALLELEPTERLVLLENDDARRSLTTAGREHLAAFDYSRVFVLDDDHRGYTYDPSTSLEAISASAGEDVPETVIRLTRERRGRVFFMRPYLNARLEAIEELLSNPLVLLGLGDSGAHVRDIMDASLPTWILSYWTRERELFSIAEAIRKLTSEPARLFGIEHRGSIEFGSYADLNLIDFDTVGLQLLEYVQDLPEGASRFVQRADGYVATIVNGQTVMDDGEHTGALSGRTLRSGDTQSIS